MKIRPEFSSVCLWYASIMSVFLLTANEPATVRKYGHENGAAVFLLTADELATVKKYGHENGCAVFI
jgi:hypothetical protein